MYYSCRSLRESRREDKMTTFQAFVDAVRQYSLDSHPATVAYNKHQAALAELLGALRSILPLAVHTSPEDIAVHAARAAIAKATGGQR